MTWTKRLTSAVLACVLCTAALTTGALAEDFRQLCRGLRVEEIGAVLCVDRIGNL